MKYTEIICNNLNMAGIEDWNPLGYKTAFSENSEFIRNISHLPENNLQQMAVVPLDVLSNCRNMQEVIDMFGRLHLLQCDPKVITETAPPSLMLRYNRYLHLFRRNTFQVSQTENGEGTWSSPYWDVRCLSRLYHWFEQSDLAYLLVCASAIDAAGQLDAFWTADRQPIDAFWEWMHKTLLLWDVDQPNGEIIYKTHIKVRKHSIAADFTGVVYPFVKKDKVWAYAYIDTTEVGVQIGTKEGGFITYYLTVPACHDGINEEVWDGFDEDADAVAEEFYDYFDGGSQEIDYRLLQLILSVAGISVNSIGWHATRQLEPCRVLNYHNMVKVDNISDIIV